MKNPLGLAVLVHLFEKPRHPYELSTTLKERRKEESIKLNYGSLYTVINSLLKAEMIQVKDVVRDGRHPEKTVYEITKQGEIYMREWMRRLIAQPEKEYPQFESALSLIPVLAPREALQLLGIRVEKLKERMLRFTEEKRAMKEMKLSRLFRIESDYEEAILKAEAKYVLDLINDIETNNGELVTDWKKVHQSLARAARS